MIAIAIPEGRWKKNDRANMGIGQMSPALKNMEFANEVKC